MDQSHTRLPEPAFRKRALSREHFGLLNPNPCYGYEERPIDWKMLQEMSPEDRNQHIVKRANFAVENDNDQRFLLKKGEVPRESDANYAAILAERRDAIDAAIELLKHSNLGAELRRVARIGLEHSPRWNQIVAFGLSDSWGSGPELVRWATQHAALLVFRELWEEIQGDGTTTIPIYLQDPLYQPLDVELLAERNMQVVCAMDGHHVGFTLVNAQSLVVTMCCTVLVTKLIGEITYPVLWFTDLPNSNYLVEDAPFKWFYKWASIDYSLLDLGEGAPDGRGRDGQSRTDVRGVSSTYLAEYPAMCWRRKWLRHEGVQ